MKLAAAWIRRGIVEAIACLVLCTPAAADEVSGNEPEPEASIAAQLREALSFDPFTLAALEVDPADAYRIALDAIGEALIRGETLQPLVLRCQAARSSCAEAWNREEFQIVLAELSAAIEDLKLNKGDWTDDHGEDFDENDSIALANAAANIVLDSPIRLLELDPEQREALWNAQALRDHHVFHPGVRHRSMYQAWAQQTYWSTVEQTLSPEQYADLTAYYERIESNLPTILEVENQAFEESRHASLPIFRAFLASKRPQMREMVPRVFGRFQQKRLEISSWLESLLSVFVQTEPPPVPTTTLGMAVGSTESR